MGAKSEGRRVWGPSGGQERRPAAASTHLQIRTSGPARPEQGRSPGARGPSRSARLSSQTRPAAALSEPRRCIEEIRTASGQQSLLGGARRRCSASQRWTAGGFGGLPAPSAPAILRCELHSLISGFCRLLAGWDLHPPRQPSGQVSGPSLGLPSSQGCVQGEAGGGGCGPLTVQPGGDCLPAGAASCRSCPVALSQSMVHHVWGLPRHPRSCPPLHCSHACRGGARPGHRRPHAAPDGAAPQRRRSAGPQPCIALGLR